MDALARLVAIDDIKQLKARYFRLMDTRDFNGMAGVFCRDAFFDCSEGMYATPVGGKPEGMVGAVIHGRDAIMAWIRGAFAEQTGTHQGHCHEITIDSDTEAHGVIAMEDYIRGLDRKSPLIHATGHYWERYRVEDGAWRIAETKLTRLFNDLDPALFKVAKAFRREGKSFFADAEAPLATPTTIEE
jgi:hypothetical protein